MLHGFAKQMKADFQNFRMILLSSSDFCDKTHEVKTICHKVRSKLTSIKK